jgi:hypothetical protein
VRGGTKRHPEQQPRQSDNRDAQHHLTPANIQTKMQKASAKTKYQKENNLQLAS